MKGLVFGLVVLFSGSVFAKLECTELNSLMTVVLKTSRAAETATVTYVASGGPSAILFGTLMLGEASHFDSKNYLLFDQKGTQAHLLIEEIPVLSHSHSHPQNCGRRICFDKSFATTTQATLDYLGKQTVYECQEALP